MTGSHGETGRLLKVDELPELVASADAAGRVYRFQDLREKHERMISDAGHEAETVLEAARVEARAIREQAFETARKDGWDSAEDDMETRVQERALRLVGEQIGEQIGVLRNAATQLGDSSETTLEWWQNTTIRLAIAIAGKLLRRQLESSPESVAEMVSAALQLSAGSRRVEVRLHPGDLELLTGDQALATSSGLSDLCDDLFVADSSLEPGDCQVRTTDGQIDARLETLLGRIATELLDRDEAA
jgi:flagellar assembly protein FliH